MKLSLDLGNPGSRWTKEQDKRLITIVEKELGYNHRYLDDSEIEIVIHKIADVYNVGQTGERSTDALRARLDKLREGVHLHVFLEYERIRREGRKYTWKGTKTNTVDTYLPDEINELDRRKDITTTSVKLFLRHDKDKGNEDLVATEYIGLDWILEGETAYYVEPKIQDTDYAQMFVNAFSLDRPDRFDEYKTLTTERNGMYNVDIDRLCIPLFKKEKLYSVRIFTDLLLVHLIDMTWIMTMHSQYGKTSNSWDQVRTLIQRTSKGGLLSPQAKEIISAFLDEKEKDASLEATLLDVYGGFPEEKHNTAVKALEIILSSVEDTRSREICIPPFRINMPKLFELFTYYQLSKMEKGRIKPLIRYQVPCKFTGFNELAKTGYPKPDFLIEGRGVLIDAKYKVDYNEESYYSNSDMRQLLAYSRLCDVRRISNPKGELKTIIAYSSTEDIAIVSSLEEMSTASQKNPDAIELYKCGIPIPKTKE